MSNRALIALIARSIRDASAETRFNVGDNDWGDPIRVTQQEIDDAETLTAFENNPESAVEGFEAIDTTDGDTYFVSDNFDINAARKALDNVKTVKKIVDDNGDYVYLTEKELKALKPERILEFNFNVPDFANYDVKIDLDTKHLEVGCQYYSIAEWKRRGEAIIRSQLGTGPSADYALEALNAALPIIEEKLNPPTRKRSRAKTAGRRSRRSSGSRTRSRRR